MYLCDHRFNLSKTISGEKLISSPQKMEEFKGIKKQILQFKEDAAHVRC